MWSESRKKWEKENTVCLSMKLQKTTDKDLLEYLEGKTKQAGIKEALRFYIEHHKEE